LPRLPDVEPTLATLRAIATAPTAPYHEWRALDAIRRELEAVGPSVETDRYGQLFSRARAGSPRHALAFVGLAGAVSIVVCGVMVSMRQVCCAGVGSALPAASVARTSNVCVPSRSAV
jgi:hypothetical protein